MYSFKISGLSGESTIIVGESLSHLSKYIQPEKTVIITDSIVRGLYQSQFPPCPVIEIGTGEKIKTFDTVSLILEKLIDLGVDRSSFIVAIGGGIVCDIAGFAASIFMRGIRFGFVSSTLLSQVDASIGGKNGVNFQGYKNLAGTFNQPEFVLIDTDLLNTLQEMELKNGFAEIIKHGLIKNHELFDFLNSHIEKALQLDKTVINEIISTSLKIKSEIVEKDEKEQGIRKILNFGHTIGHAIEKSTDRMKHGEAVACGMAAASRLSVSRGLLDSISQDKIRQLIYSFGFKDTVSANPEDIVNAIEKDKKSYDSKIQFILLKSIGEAVIVPLEIKEIRNVVYDMCQPD